MYGFNGCLLACFLMRCKFNQSKLSFPEILFKSVKIEQIWVPNDFLAVFQPCVLVCKRFEIQDSWFVWWKHDFDREEIWVFGVAEFFWHFFYESADHWMHDSVLGITFITIAVELISCKYRPMLLVSVGLCFEPALSLENVLLVLLNITEAFNWDNRLLSRWLLIICWELACAEVGSVVEFAAAEPRVFIRGADS